MFTEKLLAFDRYWEKQSQSIFEHVATGRLPIL